MQKTISVTEQQGDGIRDRERHAKIVAMQKLIDEAEEGGISQLTMAEIRAEARRRAASRTTS